MLGHVILSINSPKTCICAKACIGMVLVFSLVKCSKMSDKECCEESWMYGLKKEGLYYEGVVADLDNLLENYKRETVTTWGTRRSSTNMNGDLSDRVNAVSFVGLAIIIVRLSQRSGHTAVQHALIISLNYI